MADVMIQIGGAVSAMAAAALLVWSLFWDRARGRRRCPKCWYSLEGHDDPQRCPECGRRIEPGTRVLKTRRRWGWAVVAVLVGCASAACFRTREPGRQGWLTFLPTTALVAVVSDYGAQDVLTRALVERLQHGVVTPWDWAWAIRREAAAMPEDWSAAVKHRDRWPVGIPVRVEIDPQGWMWSEFAFRETRLWCEGHQGDEAYHRHLPPQTTCGLGIYPENRVEIPAPALGENSYPLIVESRCGEAVLATRRIVIRIEGVPNIDQVMTPLTMASAETDLRSGLDWSLQPFDGRDDAAYFGIGSDAFESWATKYAACFRVTILHEDGSVAQLETGIASGVAGVGFSAADDGWREVADFESGKFRLDGVVARFSPDPDAALRDLDYDTYWGCTFDVPLKELPFRREGRYVAHYLIEADEIPLDGPTDEWLREHAEPWEPGK